MKTPFLKSFFVAVIVLFFAVIALQGNVSAEACKVDNALGTVTYGVNIQQPGEYKLWARLRPESNTANTVYLEIDGNACLIAGDDDSLPAKTWVWVDYGGKDASKKNLTHKFESAGNHTIKVIGNESGVGIDRILLLAASDACVPDNTVNEAAQPGDNCKSEKAVSTPTSLESSNDSAGKSSKKTSLFVKVVRIVGAFALILLILFGGLMLMRRTHRGRQLLKRLKGLNKL